jgi:hypothetical protein
MNLSNAPFLLDLRTSPEPQEGQTRFVVPDILSLSRWVASEASVGRVSKPF